MKRQIILYLVLSLMTHETYNSQAAQSSVPANSTRIEPKDDFFDFLVTKSKTTSSTKIESKDEFFDFLKEFFNSKNGMIQSADLPDCRFIHVKMDSLKGRSINYVMPAKEIDATKQHSCLECDQVHNAFRSPVDCKKEISYMVYSNFWSTYCVSDLDKFLKILYGQEPGRAEFVNSRLTLKYHSEPTRLLSPDELQKEVLMQQIALLKALQTQRSVIPQPLQELPKLSQQTKTELLSKQT
ncbi:MAG TPA: hypothetical protein VLG50_01260 [Candidatus Saccharimonadales bacterium]|nr:hypothetical protein [Candidatus Saccharimonadales bacterium]